MVVVSTVVSTAVSSPACEAAAVRVSTPYCADPVVVGGVGGGGATVVVVVVVASVCSSAIVPGRRCAQTDKAAARNTTIVDEAVRLPHHAAMLSVQLSTFYNKVCFFLKGRIITE